MGENLGFATKEVEEMAAGKPPGRRVSLVVVGL
jgi:hypothetical protein